ncbi:MAG: mucoidy inhibitor MuiA family protein, partial [Gammaproteobacteria bacterium]|nr:mucoidy inhibitor MuiA family protein [Gammaproteobacteria bacterium]
MGKSDQFFSPQKLSLLTLAFPALVFSNGSFADDLPVASSIDQVTVFLNGAEVTRTGSVTVPAGDHRLIIENLPAGIDPARLRLNLSNQQIRLGTLQLQESHEGELVSDEERRIQSELDQLLYDRQEIADRIEASNTQLRLLTSLADGSVGGQQASFDIGDLSALLQTLSSSSIEAREVIRQANREAAAKDREIEQKRFELSQVATRQRTEQVLSVAISAESPVATDIAVSYPVNQARWSWLYEARLDTENRSLNLERKVSVTQGSGEDWTDVEVTITTARPNQNTQTPQLGSLLVDFYRPPSPMALESRASAEADLEEVVVTGSFIRRNQGATAASPGVEIQATQY